MLKINPYNFSKPNLPSFRSYTTVPYMTVEIPKNLYTQIPIDNYSFYYVPVNSDRQEAFKELKIDKNVFYERGILEKNENPDDFFEKISSRFFSSKQEAADFSNLLKTGAVSFSSSCYKFLSGKIPNPKSAVALELNPAKKTTQILAFLEDFIKNEKGVGINFSNFENPTEIIQKINSYFKFRQNEGDIKRPPAGIALLNVNHPKILNFISLKDNADYRDWCFDLSVVLPSDFFEKVDKDENIELANGEKLSARTIYSKILDSMLKKGEPGLIFSDNPFYICDSCAAAPLSANEGLTLAHLNLAEFFDEKTGTLDAAKLKSASNLLSKALFEIDTKGYIGILGYQDFLNKAGLKYGENSAILKLEEALSIIQTEAKAKNLKTAISPAGTISRILKVRPGLEPDEKDAKKELITLAAAQKILDGNISNTIFLEKDADNTKTDEILRSAKALGLKGITVFKK